MRSHIRVADVRSSEDGLSLIEVLVAMMIFSMLVIGIGYSLISVLQFTRDSQARETAVSLAGSELDAVRAIGDPFEVVNVASRTETVGTNTYTITRTASWVTPDGTVDTCGSGGGPLQYKSVSVTVSWVGMRVGAKPVQTDTALVPTSRINDPNKGTILVSVKNDAGLGNAGVTFTATSGGASLETSPTNSDGCSFLLGVPPGDYKITLTNPSYMDIAQAATPDLTRTVVAGGSAKFQFQFDKRGTYQLNYASNDASTPRPRIPSNMTTTFFNTNGLYSTNVTTSTLQGTQYLYPASTGYDVVAGNLVPVSESGSSCEVVDPAAWEPDTRMSPATVGIRAPTAYSPPGGVATSVGVPMGIVKVTGSNSRGYLFADSKSDSLVPGEPTCAVPMNYKFDQVWTTSSLQTTTIALPFGTWNLKWSATPTGTRYSVPAAAIEVIAPGVAIGTDGTFVLDPRGEAP